MIQYHGKPIRSVRKAFERACELAGIPRGTPHVLRHSAASHMVMAGVPIEQVARFLGDTIEMVEKVYGKWAPDYLSDAANALARNTRPRLIAATAGPNRFPASGRETPGQVRETLDSGAGSEGVDLD